MDARPASPSGGNPAWYGLYRKIIEHGKSVQAVGVRPEEIVPLLDTSAQPGLYLFVEVPTQADWETVQAMLR